MSPTSTRYSSAPRHLRQRGRARLAVPAHHRQRWIASSALPSRPHVKHRPARLRQASATSTPHLQADPTSTSASPGVTFTIFTAPVAGTNCHGCSTRLRRRHSTPANSDARTPQAPAPPPAPPPPPASRAESACTARTAPSGSPAPPPAQTEIPPPPAAACSSAASPKRIFAAATPILVAKLHQVDQVAPQLRKRQLHPPAPSLPGCADNATAARPAAPPAPPSPPPTSHEQPTQHPLRVAATRRPTARTAPAARTRSPPASTSPVKSEKVHHFSHVDLQPGRHRFGLRRHIGSRST